MPIIDCSCRGVNPECNKCDGKGYFDSDVQNKTPHIHCVTALKKPVETPLVSFKDNIKLSSTKEIQIIIKEIIRNIDLLSASQSNILKSISFKHASIPYVNLKIEKINAAEAKKKVLKEKLNYALEHANCLSIPVNIKYRHLFATTDIDAFGTDDFILLKRKLIKLDDSKNK